MAMKSLLLLIFTIEISISGTLGTKCFSGMKVLPTCGSESGVKDGGAVYYYYNSSRQECLPYSCNVTTETIVSSLFDDTEQCQAACKHPVIGGCSGTRYGCCPDGVTSKSGGDDPCQLEDLQNAESSHNGLSVQNVLIIVASVVGGVLLLLAAVTLVVVVVICRRHKRQKEERAVNNLLRMYEDAYDTSSEDDDSSEDGYDSTHLI